MIIIVIVMIVLLGLGLFLLLLCTNVCVCMCTCARTHVHVCVCVCTTATELPKQACKSSTLMRRTGTAKRARGVCTVASCPQLAKRPRRAKERSAVYSGRRLRLLREGAGVACSARWCQATSHVLATSHVGKRRRTCNSQALVS